VGGSPGSLLYLVPPSVIGWIGLPTSPIHL